MLTHKNSKNNEEMIWCSAHSEAGKIALFTSIYDNMFFAIIDLHTVRYFGDIKQSFEEYKDPGDRAFVYRAEIRTYYNNKSIGLKNFHSYSLTHLMKECEYEAMKWRRLQKNALHNEEI